MSKHKVFIGVGHGGNDPGAVCDGFKEANMNLTTAKYTKEELLRHKVDVKMSREKEENDKLADEIKECNAFKPTLAVDIHVNAGGGDGFEVFYYSGGGTSKVLAENINNEVVAIGQNSRGLKTKLASNGKDFFGFVRDTKCPAVICEGFFIDNAKDRKDFDTDAELKRLGIAYAKGILKTLGVAYIPQNTASNKPTNTNTYYRVIVGSFTDRINAEDRIKELQAKGFNDTFIDVYKK